MAALAGSFFGLMAGGGLSWFMSRSSLVTGKSCVPDTYDTNGVYYEVDSAETCVKTSNCIPNYVLENGVCKAYTSGGTCGTTVPNGTMTYNATGACVLSCNTGYNKDAAGTGCVLDHTVSYGSLTESDTEDSWAVTWPQGIVKDSSNCALLAGEFITGTCSDDFMNITGAGVPPNTANLIMCGDTMVASLDDCSNPVIGDFALNKSDNKYNYYSEDLKHERGVIPENKDIRKFNDMDMHYVAERGKLIESSVCRYIPDAEIYTDVFTEECELLKYDSSKTSNTCANNKILTTIENSSDDNDIIKFCRPSDNSVITVNSNGTIEYPNEVTNQMELCEAIIGADKCIADGFGYTGEFQFDFNKTNYVCGTEYKSGKIACDLEPIYGVEFSNQTEAEAEEEVEAEAELDDSIFEEFMSVYNNFSDIGRLQEIVDNIDPNIVDQRVDQMRTKLEILYAFKMIDVDGDESISPGEATTFLNGLSDEVKTEIRNNANYFDNDNDNKLSKVEFGNMWENEAFRTYRSHFS